MSASARTESGAASETESVVVNAIVYEVADDYVFSDGEYADILRNLREDNSDRPAPSQTSGAGPSKRRANPRVTVEEVDDEDEPSVRSVQSASESSAIPAEKKKKKKGKKKKTSKRTEVPELGVELDNLKRPGKEAEDRRARRRSSGKFDQSRVEQTPPGFRSGGYLELMHGDTNRAGRRESAGRAQPPGSDAQRPQAQGRREGAESEHRSPDGRGARNRAGRSRPSEPSDGSDDGTYQDNSESEESSETDRGDGSDGSDSSSSEEDEAHKLKRRIKRMREKQKKLEKRLTAQARSG
ncbi:hypothetical protein FRC10_007956, partial [Ceratobasidium sp. 414]